MQTKSYVLNRRASRAGLTLLELVVVLVILAALAALVVPRLTGIASQSNSATNASVVDEVNRAVAMFEARTGKQPLGWDSLLNESHTLYSKLHPNVTQATDVTKPQLQISTLTAVQASSLTAAGIAGFHDAVESRAGLPSDNSTEWHSIAAGVEAVTLVKTPIVDGHGSTFIDNAFNINQYNDKRWNNEFVVVGLGGPTSIKGVTLTEIPLVQSANPAQYYARVMCVYMIPSSSATTSFTAQYVGCFMPDGTSSRQNIDNYNSANVASN